MEVLDDKPVTGWSVQLPPNSNPITESAFESETEYKVVHVTHCALAENPTDGPHVIKVTTEDRECVLGTLGKGIAHQFPVHFAFSRDALLTNSGRSPVYLSGYVITYSVAFSDDMESDEMASNDEEHVDSIDEDDEAPEAIPLTTGNPGREVSAGGLGTKGYGTDGYPSNTEEEGEEDEEPDSCLMQQQQQQRQPLASHTGTAATSGSHASDAGNGAGCDVGQQHRPVQSARQGQQRSARAREAHVECEGNQSTKRARHAETGRSVARPRR